MRKWWCLSPPPGTEPSREDVLSGIASCVLWWGPGQQYDNVRVPRPFWEGWIIAWMEVPPVTAKGKVRGSTF